MAVLGKLIKLFKGSRAAVYNVQEQSQLEKNGPAPGRLPKDPYNFVNFTIFLFGIASLLPWNFFITATDYWNYKFRDPQASLDSTATTSLQRSFNSYLAIASKLPYIIFLVVNTAIANKVRCSRRIGWSLFVCILLFIATLALVKVDTDQHQSEFLAATLCIVVLINTVCGLFQGGGTGLTGVLPAKYMATNVMGQATGGVFATLCQLGCLLVDAEPTDAALLYFGIAIVVLIITQICFAVLVKMDFYKYYMNRESVMQDLKDPNEPGPKQEIPYWEIFMAGWKFYVSTVLIFWVTLAVFPAITALVRSSNADSGSIWNNKLFVPIACFVTFNFTDLFGRLLAKFLPISSEKGCLILFGALARIIFIPLLVLCNVAPLNRNLTKVIFSHDYQYIIIMVFFGLSNGYITTLALTYAPKACEEKYHEVAGSLAAVFLGLGLALGSLSSYITVNLL